MTLIPKINEALRTSPGPQVTKQRSKTPSKMPLLDGYALCQVARLVYRAVEFVRGVVGDEL